MRLNLPIKETPQAPWDDLKDWANVNHFKKPGELDDTAAIQRAIDSGKPTVYFPNRGQVGLPGSRWAGDKLDDPYVISDTIHIRGKVRRMIGCEALFEWSGPYDKENPAAKPMFIFEDGNEPVVWFERFSFGFKKRPRALVHASSRTWVISAVSETGYSNTGSGDLFLEDVGGGVFTSSNGQHVWARQFNPEAFERPRFILDNATAWFFGVKSEPGGPQGLVKNGSKLELTGAFQYTSHEKQQATGFYTTEDSTATYAAVTEGVWTPSWGVDEPIKETRKGETRTLPKTAVLVHGNGSAMALYSARPPAEPGPKPDKPTFTLKSSTPKAITLTISLPDNTTGVAGVKLWRNNIPLRTLWSGDFVDTGINVGGELNYQAVVFTYAGTESEPAKVSVQLAPDTTPPTSPSGLKSKKLGPKLHLLVFKASTDDLGVTEYLLTRFPISAGQPAATVTLEGTSYSDTAVTISAEYLYRVVARDASGNTSAPAEIRVTIPVTAPKK